MENSAPIKTPIGTGIASDSAIQIVVLNVVGSSPTGHPRKNKPKIAENADKQSILGVFIGKNII